VPRPETELLVDVALQWLCGRGAVTVADVGTGSGCIALAILTNNRRVRLIATDISEEALILARENATVLGHTERITFLHGDLLAPISQAGLAEEIGALVANLPYVAESEYLAAQPELHYEPRMALVAGCTGLELITRLTQQLHTLPNLAFAAIEIGARQGPTALSLVRNALPHWHVELRQDLAGLDRIVVACKDYPEHRPQ
jgi:release factor glutamine methyltransferase